MSPADRAPADSAATAAAGHGQGGASDPGAPTVDAATAQCIDCLEFVARMLERVQRGQERGRSLATAYRDIRRALCAILQLQLGQPFNADAKPAAAQIHRLLDGLTGAGAEVLALMPLLRDLPDVPVEIDWRRDGDSARTYLSVIRQRVNATSRLAALLHREHLQSQGIADGRWLTAPRRQSCVDEYFIVDLFAPAGPSLWHMQQARLVTYGLHSLLDRRYFSALTDPARLRICEDSLVCPVGFSERAGIAADARSADPDFDAAPTLLRCHIAGIQHGPHAHADKLPEPGMWLRLQRQPDNPHDPLAVRVVTPGGMVIGWLPRESNAGIANRLDQGCKLRARLLGWTREFADGNEASVWMDLEVRSLEVQDGPDEQERQFLEGWFLTDARRRVPSPRMRITGHEAEGGQHRLRADFERDQARRAIAQGREALTRGDVDQAVSEVLQAAEYLACVWFSRHAYEQLHGPIDHVAGLVEQPGAPAWSYTLAAACHEARVLRGPAPRATAAPRTPRTEHPAPLDRPGSDPSLIRRALELVGRIDTLVQSAIGDPRDPMGRDPDHIVIRAPRRVPERPLPSRPFVMDLPSAQRTGLMRTLRRLKEINEWVEAGQDAQPSMLDFVRTLGRFPLLEWEVLQRIANQVHAQLEPWEIEAVDPRLAEQGVTARRKEQWVARAFELIERPWLDRQEVRWLPEMLHQWQPARGRRRVVIDEVLCLIELLLDAAAQKLEARLWRLARVYCVDPEGRLDGRRLRLLTESLCIEATGFDTVQLSGLYPPLAATPLPWQLTLAAWERSLSDAPTIAPRLRQTFLAAARMQLETSLLGTRGKLPRRAWEEAARLDAGYLAGHSTQAPSTVLDALLWWEHAAPDPG